MPLNLFIFYLGGSNRKFLSTTWIHIIDSGGQPEFHDLLPLFAKNTSVVIFVLKACEALDHKPMVKYHDEDGCIGENRESYLTHKEILEQSLKSFHGPDGQVSTFLMIGTHKDCSPLCLDSDELKHCLEPVVEKVLHFGSDNPIAFISCLSQTEENKIVLEEIRTLIESTPGIEEKNTPLAWFGLELALKAASQKAKHKGVLSTQDCKEEAMNFALFKNNSRQFDAAMQHLVDNNIFLYYPQVLPDLVFCDPQVLLSLVTEIVKLHYKLKTTKTPRHGAMVSFESSAVITPELVSSIMKDGFIEPHLFLKLLSHLNIISSIDDSDRKYLMPALLPNQELSTLNIKPMSGKEVLPPLCIVFDGACPPHGLFCSLVANLLKSGDWVLCMFKKKPMCFFRNCVAFTYRKETVVTLVDFISHYRIYVEISPEVSCISHNVRSEIYKCIEEFANVKPHDAIECPAQHTDMAPALLRKHVALWNSDLYQCMHDNALCGPVPHKYQVWKARMPSQHITGMLI